MGGLGLVNGVVFYDSWKYLWEIWSIVVVKLEFKIVFYYFISEWGNVLNLNFSCFVVDYC